MIKSITLTNWQAHEHLHLDFTKDLNIITGLSDAGKSCIRRALDWICFNCNISESDYRREGSKETSVLIKLDNGFEIERVRSNTLNRYILRQKDCEEKVFDSIGKDIPEEVKDVLGLSLIEIDKDSLNLNIANQLTLPFLLDKPASFRAKLFNKLTGNELLDQLFQTCNRENLHISKEIKQLDERMEEQERDIEICTKEYNQSKETLQKIVDIYTNIEENVIIYDELKKLASKLKENEKTHDSIKKKLEKIVIISDATLKDLKEKVETIKNLISSQNKIQSVNDSLNKTIEKRNHLKIPSINFEELQNKAKMHHELEQMFAQLEHNKEIKEGVTATLQKKTTLYTKLKQQLKEVWNKLNFCKTCKPIAEKVIFGNKNE